MSSRTLPRNALVKPRPRRAAASQIGSARWWPWIKRALTLAFFAVVASLLVHFARAVDWHDVWDSVRTTPVKVLATAAALAACSHLLFSCFDLLGRRYTGHRLATPTVMLVNFISYAFNLNFGTLVGGVALRYRLYSRLGLDNPTITRVMTLSMLTNWLGYLALAGLVFAIAPLPLPPGWGMGNHGLQWLGVALLSLSLLYLALCAASSRRSWVVRGYELILPRPRMALLQVAMSCANWMLMAAIIYVLLQGQVAYPTVLSVLLVAAVAGMMARVPAGLGVFEAVFVALLSHQVADARLIGVLLVYRAVYYLAPLVLAVPPYLVMEARAKRQPVDPTDVAPPATGKGP